MALLALPKRTADLLILANSSIAGITTQPAGLPMPANMLTTLQASRDGFIQADDAYSAGRQQLRILDRNVSDMNSEARDVLTTTVGVLKVHHGAQWNAAWEEIGMPIGHVIIPKDNATVLNLLGKTARYLTTRATYAVPAAGVSGEDLLELQANALAARAARDAKRTEVKALLEARNAAKRKLTSDLRLVRGALAAALSRTDPRWYSYGFPRPADPKLPETPENLTAEIRESGAVHLGWSATLRAYRFRVYMKVVGSDEAPKAVKTVHALEVTLTGFTPGTALEFSVAAGNLAGEGQLSEPVAVTIPVAPTAPA